MTNLLSLMKRDVRVVRITSDDCAARTDSFEAFCQLVEESEESYPRISAWLEEQVIPELRIGSRRVALLAYEGGMPAASAVLKLGLQTKICHLKISKGYTGKRLGDLLFSLMVIQSTPVAKAVHFTLPEGLWARQGGFFRSFGFEKVDRAFRQYRSNDDELVSSASFGSVWQSTLAKLPGLIHSFSIAGSEMKPSIMLSVHPRFAELILQNKKRFEVRTRFSERWIGHRVAIYATSPLRSIVGEADIQSVDLGSPRNIWERYNQHLGCTREEFDSYTQGRSKTYAIELGNVLPYDHVVQLDELGFDKVSPPQAYCRLLEGSPLSTAAMAASLVHASAAAHASGWNSSRASADSKRSQRTSLTSLPGLLLR